MKLFNFARAGAVAAVGGAVLAGVSAPAYAHGVHPNCQESARFGWHKTEEAGVHIPCTPSYPEVAPRSKPKLELNPRPRDSAKRRSVGRKLQGGLSAN